MKLRRTLSLLLVLCLMASFVACGEDGNKSESPETTAAPTETTAAPEPTVSAEAKAALDGKKLLFIGNSYTYWGNAVINKPSTVMDQASRENDQGLFYQLCKANGPCLTVFSVITRRSMFVRKRFLKRKTVLPYCCFLQAERGFTALISFKNS